MSKHSIVDIMKRTDTVYVGFRVDRRILRKFDAAADRVDMKRTDILRNFMAMFGGYYQDTTIDALQLIDTMKKQVQLHETVQALSKQLNQVLLSEQLLMGEQEDDEASEDR